MSEYRYPSAEDIESDVAQETAAIVTAMASMADALEACPINNSLKVYAALELAFKYGKRRYVEEVFRELTLEMGGSDE